MEKQKQVVSLGYLERDNTFVPFRTLERFITTKGLIKYRNTTYQLINNQEPLKAIPIY